MREWGEMTDEAIQARNERSKRADLGLPRLPEVTEYQQEMWSVPKDAIYAARSAIETALGYMPQIKTDVPQWQRTVENDIVQMQIALTELKRLGADSSR
jgi:hypothetical protein